MVRETTYTYKKESRGLQGPLLNTVNFTDWTIFSKSRLTFSTREFIPRKLTTVRAHMEATFSTRTTFPRSDSRDI